MFKSKDAPTWCLERCIFSRRTSRTECLSILPTPRTAPYYRRASPNSVSPKHLSPAKAAFRTQTLPHLLFISSPNTNCFLNPSSNLVLRSKQETPLRLRPGLSRNQHPSILLAIELRAVYSPKRRGDNQAVNLRLQDVEIPVDFGPLDLRKAPVESFVTRSDTDDSPWDSQAVCSPTYTQLIAPCRLLYSSTFAPRLVIGESGPARQPRSSRIENNAHTY